MLKTPFASVNLGLFVRKLRFSLTSLLLFVLLTASGCGLWLRWDPWTPVLVLRHPGPVLAVAFSPDSSVLACAYSVARTSNVWSWGVPPSDLWIAQYECLSGKRRWQLHSGHSRAVRSLDYTPDGKKLTLATLVGSHDSIQTCKTTWRADNGDQEPAYWFEPPLPYHHNRRFDSYATSDKKAAVIHRISESELLVWDIKDDSKRWSIPQSFRSPPVVFFKNDFLFVEQIGSMDVYDPDSGRWLAEFYGCLTEENFNVSGERFVLLSSDGASVWDALALRRICALDKVGMARPKDAETVEICVANPLRLSADGLIVQDFQRGAAWNALSGELLVKPHLDAGCGTLAPVSQRWLSFSKGSSTVLLRAVESEAPLYHLVGSQGELTDARYSFSDRLIATASQDGSVVLWRNRRPERMAGLCHLPEFWLSIVFAAGLVFSLFHDSDRFQRFALAAAKANLRT